MNTRYKTFEQYHQSTKLVKLDFKTILTNSSDIFLENYFLTENYNIENVDVTIKWTKNIHTSTENIESQSIEVNDIYGNISIKLWSDDEDEKEENIDISNMKFQISSTENSTNVDFIIVDKDIITIVFTEPNRN
jgi:hypothetical protein